jgi:hypothetical protein
MTVDEGLPLPSSKMDANIKRILIGALLAASIFFIEVGIAEILLARDAHCRENLERLRLPPVLEEVCMPEWQVLMLSAASQGLLGVFLPEAGPILAWLVMLLIYTSFGAICTRLSTRWAVSVFLVMNLSSIALFAGLGYLSRYIVWPSLQG